MVSSPPPPCPWPSLNGGAVQLCALNGKAGEGGRGGESATKKRRPRLPKGETLLAYKRGSKRKETAKARQLAAGTPAPTGREGELGGRTSESRRRDGPSRTRGRRDGWADEISWNSALVRSRWKHWHRDSQCLPNNYCYYKLLLRAFFVWLHFF